MSLAPALSRAVYQRDGWRCRHCNDRNALHPHHVIYKSHQGPDALNNLLTLCCQCHDAHHRGFLDIEVLEITDRNLTVRFIRQKRWKPC